MNTAPFGQWSSPISASLLSQRLRLDEVRWDSDGKTLLWLEGRSGQGVIVSLPSSEVRRDVTDEHPVRGGVGYGGGEFTCQDGVVYFCARDGRLYRRSLAPDRPRPITPPFGSVASPSVSPDGKWILYVFTDGSTDLLGLVDAEGRNWPVQLVCGADFYMQPAWHPDGQRIAWVEWNHPNMPWDGSRIKLGRLAGDVPRLVEEQTVAGGDDQPVSQPQFSPDGRWLSWIEENGEWEDLVLLDLQTGDRRVLIHGDGFHLALPAWVQGGRSYGWDHRSSRVYSIGNARGQAELWLVDLAGGARRLDTAPYTWMTQLAVSPTRDAVAFLASAPSVPDRVVVHELDGDTWTAARSETESIDPAWLPPVVEIEWRAPDGFPVYGLYSPPTNPRFSGRNLPPAIVKIHGGPTSAEPVRYSLERAYFTSRGYGWLEVNHRGSTGYGRTYRNALRQRWGEVDVEDAVGGATALEASQLADGARLAIMGGSAGGYTVLNALIRHPGRFKAGVCNYGVTNLFGLNMDTHKFEAHYNDRMIGILPEAAARFHAWSPAFHVESIQDALIIFQGAEDPVVTPNQSEQMVAALRQRGVPVEYQVYAGEGHGFRKRESLLDYYPRVERFLLERVAFAA